jgi:hypothetical protein
MTRITSFVACMGLLLLGAVPRASADPIRITGGTIVVTGRAEIGAVSIVGTRGFSLLGGVDPGEGRVDPFTDCNPCLPGTTTISVGAFLGGTALPAVATLDGNTYTVGSGIDDPVSVVLELFGMSRVPAPSDSPTMVTAPFTAEGRFFLPFPDTPVLIRGGGIATLLFRPFPAGGSPETWEIDQVRYDFTDQTPVPEPATLMMVAGGLAAIVRVRKKRRSNSANLIAALESRS